MTNKKRSQRDVMRQIYSRYRANEERVISEYAQAELRGEAQRKSNLHGVDAKDYALRLLEDGKRKGWLND